MLDLETLTRLPNGENALPTNASLSCLAEKPCLVLGLTWAAAWDVFPVFALMSVVWNHKKLHPGNDYAPSFRSAEIERLPYILTHGCDVAPTDAVMWVDKSPSKALEYGGEAKVMMVFDARKLDTSGLEVRTDSAPEELERLSAEYPTRLETTDGQNLWLSRLGENDLRLGSPYEAEHGRWIRGDPWQALRLVIIFAHDALLLPDLGTDAEQVVGA